MSLPTSIELSVRLELPHKLQPAKKRNLRKVIVAEILGRGKNKTNSLRCVKFEIITIYLKAFVQ